MYEKSFVQKCLNGEADLLELDEYIEYWHTHDINVTLREYLGLTPSEYTAWASSSDTIFRDILRCRMEGISFEDYQGMNDEQRIAARSFDAEAIAKLKMVIMNRFDSVHNLAKRKIRQLGLTPPINMEEVIHSLNIEIVEKRNQYGIEAYSELGDNLRIVINPEMTYYVQRRNFTLAHELGHIFIPWHNGDIKCNFKDNYVKVGGKRLLDTQELEANIFASDF